MLHFQKCLFVSDFRSFVSISMRDSAAIIVGIANHVVSHDSDEAVDGLEGSVVVQCHLDRISISKD